MKNTVTFWISLQMVCLFTLSAFADTGTITEFPVPTSGSAPEGIAAGPDGNLWFSEQSGNKIGRITPSGTITDLYQCARSCARARFQMFAFDRDVFFKDLPSCALNSSTPC
jgi:streptogramin lyase